MVASRYDVREHSVQHTLAFSAFQSRCFDEQYGPIHTNSSISGAMHPVLQTHVDNDFTLVSCANGDCWRRRDFRGVGLDHVRLPVRLGGRSFTAMPSRSLPSSDPLTLALEPVFVYAETEISEVCYMLAGERRLSVPGDAMASFLPRG